MESLDSLPTDDAKEPVLAAILDEFCAPEPERSRVHGGKLIVYSLIMACVVLLACALRSRVGIGILYLLVALIFAGILSTLT